MDIKNIKRIVIIGCGGTGSMLAMPMCRFLLTNPDFSGDIFLVDGDSYSESNSTRQNFHPQYINTNKAEYQKLAIQSNLGCDDRIISIPKYLSKNDVNDIIIENTVVFNCADNLAIRKYVEDRVATLNNASHICCGNENHRGQVQIYYRKFGKDITPSIYMQHPEFDSNNDDRSEMSCEELSKLPGGGQLIFSNFASASIAMGLFFQLLRDSLIETNTSGISFNLYFGNYDKYSIVDYAEQT